jgi:hypothetical protein
LPLIGPTVASPERRAALGDISDLVDAGASGSPSWLEPPSGGALARLVSAHRELVGAERPLVVPQALYGTAEEDGLDETVQARWGARALLENFRAGITRTFVGHAVDWEPTPRLFEARLGLLAHDGRPKASYRVVARLLGGLADRGATHGSRRVPVTIDATEAPVAVESLLLAKRDGTCHLLLWRAGGADPLAPTPVTVRLASAPRRLAVQRLSDDTEREALPPSARPQLALGDEILDLAIDPGCATAASRDESDPTR